jgi:predicted Co/Zn/Cd cation transporter (cation efflux family)
VKLIEAGWAVIFAALVTIVCIANGWEWIAVACAAAVVLSAFLVAAQIQDTRQRHHDAELAHRVRGRQS